VVKNGGLGVDYGMAGTADINCMGWFILDMMFYE
jgi:hypothetical protein